MNLILLKNRKFMVKVLIATSVLMFFSLFTCTSKVIGVFISLWVITVFWNLYLMMSGTNLTLKGFVNSIDKEIDKAKNERKTIKETFYYAIIPTMIMGLIVVIVDIMVFFVLL